MPCESLTKNFAGIEIFEMYVKNQIIELICKTFQIIVKSYHICN